MKVASLFAGIGGICTGFKQAGFEVTWANEKDRAACNTYRHNFGDKWLHEGDVRKIVTSAVPDFDILTAGFPCQPFSVAGAQRGFSDPRGNLFFEITRVIDAKRPRVIFLENVSNLVEHDNGRTFLVIYNSLVQFGYIIKYKVMPAHEYGNLPQPRSRIFIVAFLNINDCDNFLFPEPMQLTIGINDIVDRNEKKHDIYYYASDSRILVRHGKEINDTRYIYRISDKEKLIRVKNYMCPTLTAFMEKQDKAPLILDNFGVRKLTLKECLAFQGFPKDFYFPKSVTINDAYKQIGNSVCVPVIRRIAEQIKTALQEGRHDGQANY